MTAETSQASHADIRARAIKLLARREHAPAELARKLVQRGYDPEQIHAVLDALRADNLLSVQRYAESMVRARSARGQGPQRIRADLSSAGVDDADIEAALSQAETDWSALAASERIKRYGDGVPDNFPDRAKQMRFLQRRGFSGEQINAAFDRG